MNPEQDPYYSMFEASNSDLSVLAKYWQSFQISYDIDAALRFGTLVDAMITEPAKIDYYKFTCAGVQYTPEEFRLAEAMKMSFMMNAFCQHLLKNADMQVVTVRNMAIEYRGYWFRMRLRMKADINAKKRLKMIADVKTTNAKTEKEFRQMIDVFNYDRQGAVYMDIEEVDMFIIIGISKHPPHQVWIVTMKRGDAMYTRGRDKFEDLAYLYHILFSTLQIAA